VENVIEDEISAGKDLSNVVNDNKKDEWWKN
jgi:hypothetical protein